MVLKMSKLLLIFSVLISNGCTTLMSQIQPYTNYVFANVPAKVAIEGIPSGSTPLGLDLDGHGPSTMELSVQQMGYSRATIRLHKRIDPSI